MKFKRFFCLLCVAVLFVPTTVGSAFAQQLPAYDLLLGDMDFSGTLTASDARTVLRASVGLDQLDETESIVADADLSGEVSAADARLVLRASVQLENIEKFCHLHDNEKAVFVDGGCTMPSYNRTVCKTCKMLQMSDLVAPKGHSWSDYLFDNEGNHARECLQCKAVEQTACTLQTTVVSATCETGGYTTGVCTLCGWETVSDRTAALGHAYEASVVAPTCTQEGGKLWRCSRCEDSYLTDNVPATGHSYAYLDIDGGCEKESYTMEYCTKCDYSAKRNVVPAPGHNFTKWTKNAKGVYVRSCQNEKCDQKNIEATKGGIVNWFNETVNSLKGENREEQNITVLRHTSNVNKTSNYDLSLALVKSLLQSSIDSSSSEYSLPLQNRTITDGLFPSIGREYVSLLTADEINSVTITENQKVDVLQSFPSQFTVGESSCDISDYKNTVIDNAVKVSILVNTDKATRVAKNPSGNTYKYTCGSVEYEGGSDTAISRFYGMKMKDLCGKFPQRQASKNDEQEEIMVMIMDCGLVTANMKADWYFDATTGKPIACLYDVTVFIDQEITVQMQSLIDGSFDLDTTISYKIAYLFSDYYETAA